MFSRSLVFSVLILSLAVFPLYGCSSESASAGAGVSLNQDLVSDGSGISSWDVLLVGTETGREFLFIGIGLGKVPFTDRPILDSWVLSFGPTGAMTIVLQDDGVCIDTVPASYTFNGTTGKIEGNWLITLTCDGDLSVAGDLTINFALDTVTDTISGTFSLQLDGIDGNVKPFDSTQTGTILGTRVPPPPVAPPHPGLVGSWAGIADLLTSGVRAGMDQNNLGGTSVDWDINATFDAVGNVVFDVLVSGTALVSGDRDQYTFQYTYDGFSGRISGGWFLVNDAEGDLVDTGTLLIDFVSDGTTILTTVPSGSFNATSFGTDINGFPFSETDIDDAPIGGTGFELLR